METQHTHRGRPIDHLQLVVKDLAASERFFTGPYWPPLDVPIGGAGEGYFWADELFVTSIDSPAALGAPTGRHHLAFQAQTGPQSIASIRQPPGPWRPGQRAPASGSYHLGYYAAFVLDPTAIISKRYITARQRQCRIGGNSF